MLIGPKYKICRRLGAPVFEKCQTQKYALAESRGHKTRRKGRVSDYGAQLLEKQKARFTYGMTEKQFRRYVDKAMESKGVNPAQALFAHLEQRLDNVVYRLGLATTRRQARQLVSHGHFKINGRKVTIPSYGVSKGDSIEIRRKDKAVFNELDARLNDYNQPAWLTFNEKGNKGEVVGEPVYDQTENLFDLQKVLEFYSR